MAEKYLGESVKKLGFGFMRLPRLENGEFDLDLVCRMVDRFLEAGGTYFDTAYVYMGSEEAMRKTLVERHPRDAYTIASKMPMVDTNDASELPVKFEESLRRLGTDYFDFYLLHALNGQLLEKSEKLGAWDFIRAEKEKGRIRHIGFSFHGPAEELEEILKRHPETEFVQLQINYLDWDDPEVQSEKCWATARKYNVPVVIMEPVKGGMLAAEESPVTPVLKACAPDKSIASWAIRFASQVEGLIAALSGMNSMEQLEDNLATVESAKPFTDDEKAVLNKAVEVFRSVPRVPCTGCAYCVENCPMNIKIPQLMEIYNDYLVYKTVTNSGFAYMHATADAGKPHDCVKCRSCEEHCPQKIEISDVMGKVAELF